MAEDLYFGHCIKLVLTSTLLSPVLRRVLRGDNSRSVLSFHFIHFYEQSQHANATDLICFYECCRRGNAAILYRSKIDNRKQQ